jgi:tRNA(adenine34) deaminase
MSEYNDQFWMQKAYQMAEKAAALGEVPVGAVVVFKHKIIASAHNLKENLNSPVAHAEILALHKAARKLESWRLLECDLFVTLEPCVMCAGALVQSRIRRLVYGTPDPKGGGIESVYQIGSNPQLNHQLEIVKGVLQQPCSQILSSFFKSRRS